MSELYIIRDGDHIKIGISRNLISRLISLQTDNPREVELLKTCPGSEVKERKIHNLLKDFHVRGEWFRMEALEEAKRLFDIIPNSRVFKRKSCNPAYIHPKVFNPNSDPYFEILAEEYK